MIQLSDEDSDSSEYLSDSGEQLNTVKPTDPDGLSSHTTIGLTSRSIASEGITTDSGRVSNTESHESLKRPGFGQPRSRSPSPAPSPRRRRTQVKEEDKDLAPRFKKQAKEEKHREEAQNKRILYILVARCIAFPIQSRPKVDRSMRAVKLNQKHYDDILVRVGNLLVSSVSDSVEGDFRGTLTKYNEKILRSPHIQKMATEGNLSTVELKQVFTVMSKSKVDHLFDMSPDERDHPITNSREDVIASWISLFDEQCLSEDVSVLPGGVPIPLLLWWWWCYSFYIHVQQRIHVECWYKY